jgi:glucose-1-phosphate adenylyltransferase
MSGVTVRNSLIADGCRIGKGTVIENSVIGLRCLIGEGVTIRDSILMGADYYETDGELAQNLKLSRIPLGIGNGSTVTGAILDKNCRVGANVSIANPRGLEDSDEFEPCEIRDGIPILVKDASLPDGWKMS